MDPLLGEKILFEVADVLDSYKINFWLMHGTCLGAYRDGRIILDEKDMDIGVKSEDFLPVIDSLIEKFESLDFDIEIHDRPYHKPRTLFLRKYNTLAEIMGFFKVDNLRVALTQEKHNGAYVHQAKFFDNLQPIVFLGRDFFIPNYVEEFLEETYGSDWRVPIKGKYDKCEIVGFWEKIKDKIE